MQQFKKIAHDKLGLNDTEALCYELLLIKGKLTAGEICIYANLDGETNYENIKGILSNFVEKGLAQKLPMAKGLVDVYIAVAPFKGLVKYLEELDEEMGEQRKNIEVSLQKLKDETKNELTGVRTKVETVVKEEKVAIKDSTSKANDNITQATDKSASEHNKAFDICKQRVKDEISTTKEIIKTNIDNFGNESEDSIMKFKEDTINKANETKDTIISNFDGMDKAVENLFNQSKDQFSTTLNTAKDKSIADNKSQQDNSIKNLNNWKGETFKELDNLSKFTGEKLDENLSNIKTRNLENANSLKEKITKQSDTFKTDLDNVITSDREKLGESLAKLSEQTSNNLTILQDNLSTALNQGKSTLDSSLEEKKTNLNDYLTQKLSNLNNSFIDQVNNLDSGFNEQKNSLNSKLDDQINKLIEFGKSFVAETKDAFATKIQSVVNFVKEKFKEYEDATKIHFDTIKNDVETKFKEFSDNFSTVLGNLKEASSSNMKSIEKEIDGKSTEFNDKIKSQQVTMLDNFGKTLSENTTSFSSLLDSNLSNIENGIEGDLNDIKMNLEKAINGSKDAVEKNISDIGTEFSDLATFFDEKITSDVDNAVTNISVKSDELNTKISKLFEESSTTTTTYYSDFAKNLNDFSNILTEKSKSIVGSTQSKINENLNSLQKTYFETIGKAIDSFISSINTLKDSLKKEVKAIDDGFTKATDKIGVDTLNNIDTLSNEMLISFDNAVRGVTDPIDKVLEAAMNTKNILENVWDDVKTMELLKAEGTWQIVTQYTIKAYLDAMVRRTKLHFLIVVPDMSLLPVDAIMQTKTNQKVTIACKITDKALADKLIKKHNIDLRALTEMTVSVIGADRDQEEAFYGPITKDPNEMVCTITQQEELIKIIAEMLSWFYRGRSRKYTSN